jgi:transglutaminase-like putative cysteine protease
MHAWVEVLVADPATGRELWVAYDPTHARRADETYVTVALGRDYADVTPSSGFYTGTASNTLQVKVTAKLAERRPIARSPGTAPLAPPAGFDLRAGQETQQ